MFAAFCCTRCRRPLRARGCYRGRSLRCPGCGAVLAMPAALDGTDPSSGREVRTARRAPWRAWSVRPLLPWLLLVPAVLSPLLLARAGYGILWPALGVGLGAVCLLLEQRGGWSLPARLAAPLSLALLGHGLALASPLLRADAPSDSPAPAAAVSQPKPPPLASVAGPPAASSRKTLTSGLASPFAVSALMGPDLRFVTRIDDLLALAVVSGREGGAVFVATASGSLRRFSYPDFQLQATYQLDGPAYRLAVDGRRGLLWAAVCAPGDLRINDRGDTPSGRADLHLYDLEPVRSGRLPDGARLRPRLVLPLRGDVRELLLSPDARGLFYLADTAEGVHVGRIDTERQAADGLRPLPPRTRALCLTPDGRTLYAAGDSLLVLDPDTLQLRRRIELPGEDTNTIVADDDGRVFLGARGPWTDLIRIDLGGADLDIHRWSARLQGRIYLKLSADQYRLYVGTSSAVSDHLDALLVRGHGWRTPPPVALAYSDRHAPVRGEFFLTPDGQFMVNRWGKVYRLARR